MLQTQHPRPLPRPRPSPQVEYSKQLNESRIRVLAAREEAVQGLLGEAYAALAALSKDAGAYKRLLTDLLVQVSAAEGLGWRRGAGSVCWLQTFLVACVEQHNAAPLPRCWSRRCTS